MNDFLDMAKSRCSVRSFKPDAVPADMLNRLLEAGRVAPSARNLQPWKFLVIDTESDLARLGTASKTFGAPLAIVILGNAGECWVRPHDGKDSLDIDTTIATTHILLEAESLGLSSCWICYFDAVRLRAEFNIPGHLIPVNILVIGYANGERKPRDRHVTERKSLAEIVVRGCF